MRTGTCDGPNCEATILWAITVTEKNIPLDVEPREDGNMILIKRNEEAPLALSVAKLGDGIRQTMGERGVAFYMPHHATCPDSERFR